MNENSHPLYSRHSPYLWVAACRPAQARLSPPARPSQCGVVVSLACDCPQSASLCGRVLQVRIQGATRTVGFQMLALEIPGIERGKYQRIGGKTSDRQDKYDGSWWQNRQMRHGAPPSGRESSHRLIRYRPFSECRTKIAERCNCAPIPQKGSYLYITWRAHS